MKAKPSEIEVQRRATTKKPNADCITQGGGETITYEGIAANGSPISYSITTNLDGKDAPISGTHPLGPDTVAIQRVDANTITAIDKKAGKTLYTSKTVVSKDGKFTTQNSEGDEGPGPADQHNDGLG
jgi:hypothetical protein